MDGPAAGKVSRHQTSEPLGPRGGVEKPAAHEGEELIEFLVRQRGRVGDPGVQPLEDGLEGPDGSQVGVQPGRRVLAGRAVGVEVVVDGVFQARNRRA